MQRFQLIDLAGIGATKLAKLNRAGIFSVFDLVTTTPIRYEDHSTVYEISQLFHNQTAVVNAKVIAVTKKFFKGKQVCEVRVSDGSAQATIRFWYYSNSLLSKYKIGSSFKITGKVSYAKTGMLYFNQPEVLPITSLDGAKSSSTNKLIPVYPSFADLTSKQIRLLIANALNSEAIKNLDFSIPKQLLPLELQSDNSSLYSALLSIHSPDLDSDINNILDFQTPALQKLVYEELLAHQISWHLYNKNNRNTVSYPIKINEKSALNIIKNQGFTPTDDQLKVFDEIKLDLQQPIAMNRLLQGDVGCGKTLVAALVISQVVSNKMQVCVMVPTDLLAKQQYQVLANEFEQFGYKVALLTGNTKAKDKLAILADIKANTIDIIVGTHSLFQDNVEYSKLALLIIDEQHRFGVNQRLSLQNKATTKPHQLVMTATPIPRTLAMSVYGSMQKSTIRQMPTSRKPIVTKALSNSSRQKLIARIKVNCEQGLQVYWVCTLVKNSETLDAEAAEEVYDELCLELPTLNIALVHGQQKSKDREQVMQQFEQGSVNLLVATTVIEVGINVPNASIIVIENPERLGLSQLHQLRGRVGRGNQQAFCILLHNNKVSNTAQQRINALCKHTSGFDLAEIDLKLRGPGELLGTKQKGQLNFKLTNLERDGYLLQTANKNYKTILQDRNLAQALVSRWLEDKDKYINI